MRQTPARTSTIRYGTHDASSACKLSVSGRADSVGERDDRPTLALCPVCTGGYSRALIRHMVTQKEMLGGILLSMHNIYYLLNLMQRSRQAIIEGRYGAFVSDWMNSPAAVDY